MHASPSSGHGAGASRRDLTVDGFELKVMPVLLVFVFLSAYNEWNKEVRTVDWPR